MSVFEDKTIRRSGVIPYVKKGSNVYFIFGLDEGVACISDFGGTRESYDSDVFENAIREFHEETFNVLGPLKREHLLRAPYIIGKTGYHKTEKCSIFFVLYHQEFPFESMMSEFKNRNVPGDETRGLIVLSKEQLIIALNNPEKRIQSSKVFHFHPKVRAVLLSGMDTISSL